jgi:protein gp37
MPGVTRIEWADFVWNPTTGCTKVSTGCAHCYAERQANRFKGLKDHPYESGFSLVIRPERLRIPIEVKKGLRIFVNSMSDLFHEGIPESFISEVIDVTRLTPQHTYIILTKRSERLRELAPYLHFPPNVWVGVSVESEDYFWRIKDLRHVEAKVRLLSIEPMLTAMPNLSLEGIQWVIVGGESGPKFRPMQPDWVREIRDKCNDADVAFFFKQWAGRFPKELGRMLDGCTWSEFPVTPYVLAL